MQPRTIAVLGQKGGTGKTTIATHLASAAHLGGARTLLLDIDRQGSATDWFSSRSDTSKLHGLNVSQVARGERSLTLAKFRELARGYAVVVCDGPARLGDMTRAAAAVADVVVVPLRAGPLDWWAAKETVELLDAADEIRAELDRPPVQRLFVLNQVPLNQHLTAFALEAMRSGGSRDLPPVAIPHQQVFGDAMFEGETALTTAPRSAGAREIARLFKVCMLAMEAS
jgi:chromosome partitioning protein